MDRLLEFLDSKQRLADFFSLIGREFVGVEIIGFFLNPLDNPDLEEDAVPREDFVGIHETGGDGLSVSSGMSANPRISART